MAERATVARPYARAAFAHAREHRRVAEWSAWLASASAVVSSESYQAFESSPGVRSEQLLALIAGVAGEPLGAHGKSFLALLAENGRVPYLPEVSAHFEELKAADENVADVEVVSAVALDAQQKDRLATALRGRLKRDVRLNCSTDPALIGGAVVRTGDLLIDGSLRGKLERLQTELTG